MVWLLLLLRFADHYEKNTTFLTKWKEIIVSTESNNLYFLISASYLLKQRMKTNLLFHGIDKTNSRFYGTKRWILTEFSSIFAHREIYLHHHLAAQKPVLPDFKGLEDKSTGKHYIDACYWLAAI